MDWVGGHNNMGCGHMHMLEVILTCLDVLWMMVRVAHKEATWMGLEVIVHYGEAMLTRLCILACCDATWMGYGHARRQYGWGWRSMLGGHCHGLELI